MGGSRNTMAIDADGQVAPPPSTSHAAGTAACAAAEAVQVTWKAAGSVECC